MLIVYVKCEDNQGWLRSGTLIDNIIGARTFKTLSEVYQVFADYYEYDRVQFDIYKITFDGWVVAQYNFEYEAEARGAGRVLNVLPTRCRRCQQHKKPYRRLSKKGSKCYSTSWLPC